MTFHERAAIARWKAGRPQKLARMIRKPEAHSAAFHAFVADVIMGRVKSRKERDTGAPDPLAVAYIVAHFMEHEGRKKTYAEIEAGDVLGKTQRTIERALKDIGVQAFEKTRSFVRERRDPEADLDRVIESKLVSPYMTLVIGPAGRAMLDEAARRSPEEVAAVVAALRAGLAENRQD